MSAARLLARRLARPLGAVLPSAAAALHHPAGLIPEHLGVSGVRPFGASPGVPIGTDGGAAKVLVKIGGGEVSDWDVTKATLAGMDRMGLLEALAKDDGFRNSLEGVPLDKCKISLLKEVIGDEPTALEETRVLELRGARTMGELLESHGGLDGWLAEKHGKIVVRVHLPDASGSSQDDALPRFKRLYDALLAAQPEPILGGASGASLINLPPGVEWPQLGAAPLFVRSFYAGCVDGPLSGLDPSGTAGLRKFVVIGNAGIGKSAFGSYLLWRAVQARRTVAYVSDKMDDAFIFHGDGRVESFVRDHFNVRAAGVRRQRSTVLLVDGITPPVCDAFTVLLSSPKRERYREFLKVGDSYALYFPVFSRSEMRDMRDACFHAVDEAGVWERYSKWGGIPRYVLQKLLPNDQYGLDDAVTKVGLTRIGYLLNHEKRLIESADVVSHRLFHLKPAGETGDGFEHPSRLDSYTFKRIELGSPYIEDAVTTALVNNSAAHVYALLGGPIEFNPGLSKVIGETYPRVARARLAKGGSFQCFDLRRGVGVGAVQLPAPCDVVYFHSAADLGRITATFSREQLDKTIFTPYAGNYTGLDAVLPGCRPVNFTINIPHNLKLQHATLPEGVMPVVRALQLPEGDDVHFFWVLPRLWYEAVCSKSASKAKDGEVAGKGKGRKKAGAITGQIKGPEGVMKLDGPRVVQFALLVDFNE